RNMVRTLGRPMGIKFDEEIYGYLTNVYGGHPYLIRQACSWQHKKLSNLERPLKITIDIMSESQQKRDADIVETFVGQIVQLMAVWYPEEFDLLIELAHKEYDYFRDYSNEYPNNIKHLVDYGLVERMDIYPFFRFTIATIEAFFVKAKSAEHERNKMLSNKE